MGGSQHRHSSLAGRELEHRSVRLDSRTGTTVMTTDKDEQQEVREPHPGGTHP